MLSDTEIEKMDSLIDFFSKCFYSQFGIYPRVWYDVAGRKDNLRINIIKDIVDMALDKEFPGKYSLGIRNRKKDRDLVVYRQYYFYLCMNRTSATLDKVGKEIGNFNHATVLYGVRCIEKILEVKDKTGLRIIKNVDLELVKYTRENQLSPT